MVVLAHESGVWSEWSPDPALIGCALAGLLYAVGLRRLWSRFGIGHIVGMGQALAFWAGLATTLLALISPLDAIADDLFSVHMIQHLLIGLLGPLLLIVGQPLVAIGYALPKRARSQLAGPAHRFGRMTGFRRDSPTTASLAVGLNVLVLGLWHVPRFYDLAVRDPLVHDVEHLAFFASGLLLWWIVIGAGWRARSGMAVVYLFLAGLPMGALAALITLAPSPFYTSHLTTTYEWGLSPLEDQQLAGAIMWVPGGVVYLTAAVALFVGWLGSGPAAGEQRLSWRG